MAVECQVHYAGYKSPRAKGYAADRKQIQQGDCSSVERAVKVFSSHAVECKSSFCLFLCKWQVSNKTWTYEKWRWRSNRAIRCSQPAWWFGIWMQMMMIVIFRCQNRLLFFWRSVWLMHFPNKVVRPKLSVVAGFVLKHIFGWVNMICFFTANEWCDN